MWALLVFFLVLSLPEKWEETQLDLAPVAGFKRAFGGSGPGQLCGKPLSAVKHGAFRVRLSLMTRRTGKRRALHVGHRPLWHSQLDKTAIHLEFVQLQPAFRIHQLSRTNYKDTFVLARDRIRSQTWYVLELISRNFFFGALFYVCHTFVYKQCGNIQVLLHPCLNNGTFSGSGCIAS